MEIFREVTNPHVKHYFSLNQKFRFFKKIINLRRSDRRIYKLTSL